MKEHFDSNKNVRDALVKADIYPENLPPTEDIKAIEARHRKERVALERQQRKELDVVLREEKKKNGNE